MNLNLAIVSSVYLNSSKNIVSKRINSVVSSDCGMHDPVFFLKSSLFLYQRARYLRPVDLFFSEYVARLRIFINDRISS